MKIQTYIALLSFLPLTSLAQAWIQIDLNQTGPAAAGGYWNVISTPTTDVGYLVNTNGTATTATLAISTGWQDSTFTGAKGAYGSTVFGNAADDYFFIRSADNSYTNGTLTVSGLSNGVPYAVQLASSMLDSTEPRIADFRVNGVFGTSSPDGLNFNSHLDGWVGGNIITWSPVYPVGGQFVISVVKKSSLPGATASLNALRIGPAGDLMATPVLTQASALSDTEIEVAWTGDYPVGTPFVISYHDGSSTRKLNVGDTRSAWITGLLPSTTFTVRVAPSQSTTSLSNSKTVTTKAPPPADKKFEIDFNTQTSAANWICPAAPNTTPQTIGGLTLNFVDFTDSSAVGHTGLFSTTLFGGAANDYFFVYSGTSGRTGTLTISGLANKAYRVQLCSSASTSDTSRIADFRVNGAFSSLTPTGQQYNSRLSGYDGARVMTWPSVKPVDGVITVTVTTASSTYYGILNGMRIVELPPEASRIIIQ